MNTRDRVSQDELDHDLGQAAASQINAEMLENLDVQPCDECGEQWPSTELDEDAICNECNEGKGE